MQVQPQSATQLVNTMDSFNICYRLIHELSLLICLNQDLCRLAVLFLASYPAGEVKIKGVCAAESVCALSLFLSLSPSSLRRPSASAYTASEQARTCVQATTREAPATTEGSVHSRIPLWNRFLPAPDFISTVRNSSSSASVFRLAERRGTLRSPSRRLPSPSSVGAPCFMSRGGECQTVTRGRRAHRFHRVLGLWMEVSTSCTTAPPCANWRVELS